MQVSHIYVFSMYVDISYMIASHDTLLWRKLKYFVYFTFKMYCWGLKYFLHIFACVFILKFNYFFYTFFFFYYDKEHLAWINTNSMFINMQINDFKFYNFMH